ncbi:hypothetical protein [Methylogaea oryzae]|uniref:HTH cro/C1-type domain-containing protein n=1 Tax=Methylogaea oryzae TaxID=1295382 RepID=A0A8D4VMN2_9GAMM|nr:hypothetical protein [Methylogaea oryzae]BBL70371.1 hypothetical protein MoryE10_09770 [Methylogaea oryzae]
MPTNNELKTPFLERLALLIGDEEPYAWARRTGIPKSGFWAIWSGASMPQKKTLAKIETATGASPDWLLHGLGEPPPAVRQRIEQPLGESVPVAYTAKEGGLNSDRNLEYRAAHGQLDMERLALAIETVEEGLRVTKRTMASDKKAELVAAVYDLFEEERTPAMKERVLRLVKSAA